jgi:hypothetical protein
MLPRRWGASTKQRKDEGSLQSRAMEATEDAAMRRVIAFQSPRVHCRVRHYRREPNWAVSSTVPIEFVATTRTR